MSKKIYRKDAVKRVFQMFGKENAMEFGLYFGLKESTLRTWISRWMKTHKAV